MLDQETNHLLVSVSILTVIYNCVYNYYVLMAVSIGTFDIQSTTVTVEDQNYMALPCLFAHCLRLLCGATTE